MTEPTPGGFAPGMLPDPNRIATRSEFGAELTLARLERNLSVRQVAKAVGVPFSTVGGYFAGTHLPAREPADVLDRLLSALGIANDEQIANWWRAYRRVRQSTVRESAGDSTEPAGYLRVPQTVSTRPPLDRLLLEPTLRGRDELVHKLSMAIDDPASSPRRVHIIHGLSGSGKSMVALTIAKVAAARNIPTFWATADSHLAVVAGMHALAARIGVSPDLLRRGSLPDAVWDRLHALTEPWLLVLDNADDPPESLALPQHRLTDGTGWLRSVESCVGTVIVTTRDGDPATWGPVVPPWITLHRLEGLTPEHGGQVLSELAGTDAGSRTDAVALSDRLGGLAFAVMLVGRFLAESRRIPASSRTETIPRTYRGYLDALRHGKQGDLFTVDGTGRRPRHGAGTTIEQIYTFSLDLLTARDMNHARPLLNLLACVAAAPIPYSELLRADLLCGSSLFAGLTTRSLWQSLHALEGVGLITLTDATGDPPETLDMHPLARDLARGARDLHDRIDEYLTTAETLIDAAVRDADPESPRAWPRWRLLAEHCVALVDLVGDRLVSAPVARAAVELSGRAASYQRAAGMREQAEDSFAVSLRCGTRILAEDDAARLGVENSLARLYYDQARYTEAEQLYRQVLGARRRTLGAEHGDTLTTQHYLARTLRNMDRLDEAEVLLLPAYEVRLRLWGPRHPDTLTAHHGIADLARARGEFIEAAKLYQEILAARSAVLGGDHPATLTTRQYRAEMLYALERTDEAESEMRRLWVINQRVRGFAHPRTLAVGHALADLLHNSGSPREAAALTETVLSACRRVFGNMHPTTLKVRYLRGLIRLDLGETAIAYRELEAVLADRTAIFGPNHPHIHQIRGTLEAIRHRIGFDPAKGRAG